VSAKAITEDRSVSGHRILVTSGVARLQRVQLDALNRDGFTLRDAFELDRVEDDDVLTPALTGVWGTIAGGEAYSRAVLERASDLRVVVRCGVGYDAVDVDAASELGVTVVTTPGANDEAVADFTLAIMLACLRQVVQMDRSVRSGGWRLALPGRDLANATVGIVGLGLIGRAVARRLAGFGCRILVVDPAPDREFCERAGVEVVTLDELLPQVDVLTVHAPLLPATRGLIGERELALLPREAIVVNAARGGVVAEEALVAALSNGQIAGAALDVFEHEPLGSTHPLARMDNVVLTPHAAGLSRDAVTRMIDAAMSAVRDVAAGRVPKGCVNPDYVRGTRAQR